MHAPASSRHPEYSSGPPRKAPWNGKLTCGEDKRLEAAVRVSLWKRAALSAQDGANSDIMALEPALFHFEDIENVFRVGIDGSFIEWFHVVELQDGSLGIDVSAGE